MPKAFFLSLAVFVLAAGVADAAEVSAAPRESASVTEDLEWKSFDDVVSGAKAAMMADPQQALDKARLAERFADGLFRSPRQSESSATALWLEAEALSRLNRIADARAAIDRAIRLAEKDERVTDLNAHLALTLARIADSGGDIALALKSYHKAHDIFAALVNTRGQAMALQGLGTIYDEAHDFDHAIEYYRRASQVYAGDPSVELAEANNVGFALVQLKRYDEALTDFRHALDLARAQKSPYLQASVLTNLAWVYAKRHQFEEAEHAADEALHLLGPHDDTGQAPFVWGVKADIAFAREMDSEAVADIERAFQGIDLKTTVAPFRDMHEIAYKIYRDQGNTALALAHLEAFKRLDDEGRELAASANLALVGARFDFTAQQLEIEHLKAEQLGRDISLRESRAATQIAIYAGLLLLSVVLTVWVSWRNISARKHRNEITRANQALTSTLAERDREIVRRTEVEGELRQAKDAAEAANRAKSQFLANMSHELRTPLNAIMGFSEMIAQEAMGPVGNPTYKGYAGDIYASGKHLLAILNDLLDMARIDAGKVSLVEDDIVLGDVVESALRVIGNDVRHPDKAIRFTPAEPRVRLMADERVLRQIVINLVSNALKFTGKDGIVDVRIERVPDGVDIIVSDNGIGIPDDKLDLVMEPFGQAGDAFARSRGGIGLGLPIVKSLAELHGGRFTLASKLDEGTVARVHLPEFRVLGKVERRPALAG